MKEPVIALTDTAIKQLKAEEKPYKVGDDRGLYLLVKPQGSKLWRWKYRHQGRSGPYGAPSRRFRSPKRSVTMTEITGHDAEIGGHIGPKYAAGSPRAPLDTPTA